MHDLLHGRTSPSRFSLRVARYEDGQRYRAHGNEHWEWSRRAESGAVRLRATSRSSSRNDATDERAPPPSRFDIRTGAVVEGPAVFVQPRLETRVREGKIEIGFPDAEAEELPELAALERPPDAGGALND